MIDNDVREEGLEAADRYYGSYRGFVADNEDPTNSGRLKVMVPDVYGDDVYDYWALPKGIYAGNGVGSYWIPSKKDNIWVSFEGGDIRFPIWEYGWWGDSQAPEGSSKDVKVLQTNSGHRIEMDDVKKHIRIKNSEGLEILISKTGIVIESRDKGIKLYSNNTSISLNEEGIDIDSDKVVNINGGYEALYNKISGAPIANLSQIGTSKKVKIG